MTLLELKSICLIPSPFTKNIEYFNEYIDVYIGIKGEVSSNRYQINVLSYEWLANQNKIDLNNDGEYLKFAIVLQYYDETAIKHHLHNIIKKYSPYPKGKAFNCLKYHLEYEYEEFEY